MRKVAVPDEGAESLFGNYDENLKHLEAQFTVRIRSSGHELIVEGDTADVARAERVLDQLSALIRGRVQVWPRAMSGQRRSSWPKTTRSS
jgi:phosphate starvation-inducible protein PhoH and related proteins